jgi:hypothetical protein
MTPAPAWSSREGGSPVTSQRSEAPEGAPHGAPERFLVSDVVRRQLLQVQTQEDLRSTLPFGDDEIIPALIEVLRDQDLAMADAPGDGHAPIRAARLLGDLKSPAAIEPLLDTLLECEPMEMLFDACLHALTQFGEAVVEPAFARLPQAGEEGSRSLASVLSSSGARDSRILSLLLVQLAQDDEVAPGNLAEYGDPAALPALFEAYDRLELSPDDSPFANQDFIEVAAAIEELGGELTPLQAEKFAVALKPREEWRERLLHAFTGAPSKVGTVTRRERPGTTKKRNSRKRDRRKRKTRK